MSFNLDRGLIDPTNGLLMIDEINFNNLKLQPNENQKYYEGENINAFGGWQLENIQNDLKYIQKVQNRTDETNILDSTLFDTQPIDNDIYIKMNQDNPNLKKANDYVKEQFNSFKNADIFANQLTMSNSEDIQLLNLVKNIQEGKEYNLDFLGNQQKENLKNILNQQKDDFKKVNDIKNFIPELSQNINKTQPIPQPLNSKEDTIELQNGLSRFLEVAKNKVNRAYAFGF